MVLVKSAGLADGWLKGQGGRPGEPQVSGLAPTCGSIPPGGGDWLEGDRKFAKFVHLAGQVGLAARETSWALRLLQMEVMLRKFS